MRLVRAYTQTGNVTQAAATAGYNRQWASELLNGALAPVVLAAYEAAGITLDAIALVLRAALDAEKTLLVPDGQGGATPHVVPDHQTRLKAAQVALGVLLRLADLSAAQEAAEQEQARSLSRQELEGLTAMQLIEVIRQRERKAAGGD
jgi:hypothetical protein